MSQLKMGKNFLGNICLNIQLVIQGHAIRTDLLVASLGVPQIILGTVWLKSIRPTLWDFDNLTLKFWKGTKELV